MSDGERRQFGRTPVEMAVIATGKNGRRFAGLARDLSLDGVFICCNTEHAREGMKLHLRMTHNLPKMMQVEAHGVVKRITPGGLGVHFTTIGAPELKHIYHLLMEYALVEG